MYPSDVKTAWLNASGDFWEVPTGETWTLLGADIAVVNTYDGCTDESYISSGVGEVFASVPYSDGARSYPGTISIVNSFNQPLAYEFEEGEYISFSDNDICPSFANGIIHYIEYPYASSTMEIVNPSFNLFGGLVLFLLVVGFFMTYFKRHG